MIKKLILASQSPRRKEILSFFSIPFEQKLPDFEEESITYTGNPCEYANILSKGKARSLSHRFPDCVILSADTIVYKDGILFNKPTDHEDACAMLESLQGSCHSVFTSVTAQLGEKFSTACEETKVTFHPLTKDQLKSYRDAFSSLDKSGGYGIEKAGSIIVKRIDGCFYNVLGLPINSARYVLMDMGIDLWHFLN